MNVTGLTVSFVGRYSLFGTAIRYGLEGPGIELPWERNYRTSADRPWGSHSLLCKGYRLFRGGEAVGMWR